MDNNGHTTHWLYECCLSILLTVSSIIENDSMSFNNKIWGATSLLRLVFLCLLLLSLACFWESGRVTQSLLEYGEDSPRAFDAPLHVTNNATNDRLRFATLCSVSCSLPPWMQQYMQWHTSRLQGIQRLPPSQQPWKRQRLLVVRCLAEDRCGGTADRLKSLPLYLAIAAKNKRLLFLRWTRPFRLEEFMTPGEAFNWTVPEGLAPLLDDKDDNTTSRVAFGAKALPQIVRATHNPRHWLVEGAAQMAGGDLFQTVVESFATTNETFQAPQEFFHEMFLTLFRPAPALYKLVEHQMQALDIRPNQFVTAHIRAKYPGEPYRQTWNVTLLNRTVTNAIDCASSLASNLPIYVASDTLLALQAAQAYGNNTTPVRVVSYLDVPTRAAASSDVALVPHQDPPHLNFAQKDDPSAFYSIFADLFLMSQSRCVSFGAGGFGRFGSLISFNATCQIAHSSRGKRNQCTR